VACRVEPAAGAAFDELVEVLQQIYLNFRLVFLVDTVYRHGGMETPFAFTRTARELPKRQTFFREWEPGRTPAGSCRLDALSGGQSRAGPTFRGQLWRPRMKLFPAQAFACLPQRSKSLGSEG
jgi:hypothetical protein